LLIFGCAQDDTQRVEQKGVCACRMYHLVSFSDAKFFEILDQHVWHLRTPYCGKEWKIPFFGRHQKKAAPKMQAMRERTSGEWRAYSRVRLKSHNR